MTNGHWILAAAPLGCLAVYFSVRWLFADETDFLLAKRRRDDWGDDDWNRWES